MVPVTFDAKLLEFVHVAESIYQLASLRKYIEYIATTKKANTKTKSLKQQKRKHFKC